MNQMDFEQARFNMIEQQIRPWDVLDQQVLDIISGTPREDFVPEQYRALAFADINIPLGHDQVMMPPRVEGRLLQALDIQSDDSILEIGTGSAYLCACLARMGARVHSIDIIPEFIESAKRKLAAHNIANVSLAEGDAGAGWTGEERYDAIAVTGSLPAFHEGFHQSLSIGGRLFLITGTPPVMEALLMTRVSEGHWSRESLFETSIPALIHAEESRRFVF